MQYLDKLKKQRSIDRVIFLAGMVLAFIGFIIPTIYVKQIVVETDLTKVSADSAAIEPSESESDELAEASDEFAYDEDDESEYDELAEAEEDEDDDYGYDTDDYEYDDTEREFHHFASKREITTDYKKKFNKDVYGNYETDVYGNPKFEYILDKNGNKIIETVTTQKYVIVDAEVNDDGEFLAGEDGKPKFTYVLDFDENGFKFEDDDVRRVTQEELDSSRFAQKTFLFNLFGAVNVFNQAGLDYGDVDHVSGNAYNATFLVIVWLCTIAAIILFFVSKTIIGDVIVLLIAIAFGLAASFTIPLTLDVPFIVGSFSVGAYFVAIGLIVALVGTILGAAHIQHPALPGASTNTEAKIAG